MAGGLPTKRMPFEFSDRWTQLGPEMGLSPEVIRLLDQRDRELENFLSNQPIVWPRDPDAEVFRSMPWTAKTFAQIKYWAVEIGQDDAGDDEIQAFDVDVELHVDGVVRAAVTLPAGQAYIEYDGLLPKLAPGARVTMYCEQTGFSLICTAGF